MNLPSYACLKCKGKRVHVNHRWRRTLTPYLNYKAKASPEQIARAFYNARRPCRYCKGSGVALSETVAPEFAALPKLKTGRRGERPAPVCGEVMA